MEPDVRAFLMCIVQTISMGMMWLLLNMTFGIYFNFAFFENTPSTGNIIYYIFLIGSFTFLVFYLRRKWKGFREIGEE
jgi:membrane-anchored protein YejM (alkaline phosphatase superfamily)